MQNEKVKRIPERRCLGCGQHFPKKELIRVVRAPDGTVSLDFTGKKSGRGAYLCHSTACFRKARKSHRIEQNLTCPIPDAVYDALEEEIAREAR